jgi:sigma-B regulation protein RsbU (phosphoserine phosphatase)
MNRSANGNGGDGIVPDLLIQVSFPSIPDRLRLVRPIVRDCAFACGFEIRDADDIVLAVDEACANVIEHAYVWCEDSEILVNIFRIEHGIHFQVRDFAPPASLRDVRRPDPETLVPGGLGTHFIRSIMDDTRFLRAPEGNGNILELTKRTMVDA